MELSFSGETKQPPANQRPPLPPPCSQPGAPSLRPRPGALIANIAGTPVSHLNLSGVASLLDELTAESSGSGPSPFYADSYGRAAGGGGGGGGKKLARGWTQSVLPKSAAARGGGGGGAGPESRRPRPRRQRHQLLLPPTGDGGRGERGRGGDVIRVVLREVEVHAWPPNWRHEVR